MSNLQHALALVDQLLAHCRQHLQPEELEALARRVTSTPIAQGYSVQEPWSARMQLDYWWQKLSRTERRAWLRQQRLAQKRQEAAP